MDDGVDDDDDVPNTPDIIQHLEDLPSFMRALDLQAEHAPKFPQYANMASDYAANGELYAIQRLGDCSTSNQELQHI